MDVLIVDDDAAVRKMMASSLERAGFLVRSVDNGLAALGELGEAKAHVILLDVAMPYLGGIRLYEELLDLYPEQAKRVAFVSGMLSDPVIKEVVEKTGQPSLTKPFEIADLIKMVYEMEAREK